MRCVDERFVKTNVPQADDIVARLAPRWHDADIAGGREAKPLAEEGDAFTKFEARLKISLGRQADDTMAIAVLCNKLGNYVLNQVTECLD